MPENEMHPDGIIPFNPNNKYYLIVFGIKCYSNIIGKLNYDENEKTTDLSKVYFTKKNKILQKNLTKYNQFHNHFNNDLKLNNPKEKLNQKKIFKNIGGIIRIIVNYPFAKKYTSHTEGIITNIYIDKDNIEKIIKNKNVLKIIEKIPGKDVDKKIEKIKKKKKKLQGDWANLDVKDNNNDNVKNNLVNKTSKTQLIGDWGKKEKKKQKKLKKKHSLSIDLINNNYK
jgi:hypothetical protein